MAFLPWANREELMVYVWKNEEVGRLLEKLSELKWFTSLSMTIWNKQMTKEMEQVERCTLQTMLLGIVYRTGYGSGSVLVRGGLLQLRPCASLDSALLAHLHSSKSFSSSGIGFRLTSSYVLDTDC